MTRLFKNGSIYYNNRFQDIDFIIDDEGVLILADNIDLEDDMDEIYDLAGLNVFPGFIKTHISLNGEYSGTVKTETLAGAKGGYTTLFVSPTKDHPFDNFEAIKKEEDLLYKNAFTNLIPVCSITKDNELVNIKELSKEYFVFSNNNHISENLMEKAMLEMNKYDDYLISDNENDISLALKTKTKLHIYNVSSKKSIEAIKKAKENGAIISAEVNIHQLLLNEGINKEDQDALIEGIKDGTIDMIYGEELEITFSILYTKLVKTKIITLEKLIELLSINPSEVFEIEGGRIINMETNDLCIYNLHDRIKINPKTFVSDNKETPFENEYVNSECLMTICNGQIVYQSKGMKNEKNK